MQDANRRKTPMQVADEVPYTSPTAQDYPRARYVPFLEKWFAFTGPEHEILGEGSYGIAYRMNFTPAGKKRFRYVFKEWEGYSYYKKTSTGDWYTPRTVAVKINAFPPIVPIHPDVKERFKRKLKEQGQPIRTMTPGNMQYTSAIVAVAKRELHHHRMLAESSPVTIAGTVYDARKVIPDLYATGYDKEMRATVVIMEELAGYIPILTLVGGHRGVARKPVMPKWFLDSLLYAIASLWLQGFVHLDLHGNNIMVNPAKKRVKIIDFGTGARVDAASYFKIFLARNGLTRENLIVFWNDMLQSKANRVYRGRTKQYTMSMTQPASYYPNIAVLQYGFVESNQPVNIASLLHRLNAHTPVELLHNNLVEGQSDATSTARTTRVSRPTPMEMG